MFDLFYRKPRLTILLAALILVAGLSSYYVLPRMEDPLLTKRIALVNTLFPGANAERVEALVTEKLEEKLRTLEEIKKLRSVSRAGVSTITIELRDDIFDVDPVWSKVRDKLDDALPFLPTGARKPAFEELDVKAYALIVSLHWTPDDEPNYAVLRRLAEQLEDQLRGLRGTEEVDTFGDPQEEIVVEIRPADLAALGLTVAEVSAQIQASDSKVSAGQLRSQKNDLLLEVEGELDSLKRIERIPIHFGDGENFVALTDIADVKKGITEPPDSLAFVKGQPAVVLGVLVRGPYRLDYWMGRAERRLSQFADQLPAGVELSTVFEQNRYVANRLNNLLFNLLLGGLAVTGVVLLLMGWRNALIVALSLPLSALMVLSGMRFLDIPIHQMSVTGLIIALGLLIDNAIVMVDEVSERLRAGNEAGAAVASSVRHLAVPLLGSTVTTALAFAPIALMPGPAGEFVGSIAVSVILAIASSFLLAMTVVPALAAVSRSWGAVSSAGNHWWQNGFAHAGLTEVYRRSLRCLFARPVLGILLALVLPVLGFIQARHLPEQFFPPADRNQFHIEVELPPQASLQETQTTVRQIRQVVLKHPETEEVSWFLGQSAPSFYYNVVAKRRNTASYAQALVQLKPEEEARELIHQIQGELDRAFPKARILVRQLEQGPPFDAPIEVRLYGHDLEVLRQLGDRLRVFLTETENVIHTRSDLTEVQPKLSLIVDEEETRLLKLNHTAIAKQLDTTLEGAVGGSILEETEELLVRVRLANSKRSQLAAIASLDVQPGMKNDKDHPGVPLTALAKFKLVPETASIPRQNSRRMNEVQAFIKAGVLPATVLEAFKEKLRGSGFTLPPGYSMEFGGEAAERDNAIGNLMVNVGVLMVLMVATLVLSFGSFRMAGLIGAVAALSVGLGLGALWLFGYPFGFMAIVGTMGLIGVAINDAIVVLAALREHPQASEGQPDAVADVVVRSTRHIVATSFTTMAGFLP